MPRTRTITAAASCRADLAGGTVDIWPLYLFHPGAVTVNFALSIMTRCELRTTKGKAIVLRSLDTGREDRFRDREELVAAHRCQHTLAVLLCRHFLPAVKGDGGFTLTTDSESPAGAGISGSSALMVATAGVLARYSGARLDPEQLREVAQNVEAQIIRVPTGCQDYYPALYGGVSALHLTPGGIVREGLPVSAKDIEARFLLVYTGSPRQSGINNWEVFKAHIGGDLRIHKNFDHIVRIARDMRAALIEKSWDTVAELLREEWKLRKTNAPGISTPLIEKLVTAARRNGARAVKVCGAGGGGCLILFVDAGAKPRVARTVTALGGTVLPFRLNEDGLEVKER